MKILSACFLLVLVCASAQAEEPTFEAILARVSQRDPITNAILKADNNRMFQLEIKGDHATVRIWKNLKVIDPNQEEFIFPLSDVVRQEHLRLKFQDELNKIIARCTESEQRFRVSQYNKHPIRFGMPYEEAVKLLGDEFEPDGIPRAEAGASRLESDKHSIIFRHRVLKDVITKEVP